jgi:predicted nucleic acid-binding protein
MRAALAKAFRDGRLSHAGIPIDHGEYDDLVGRFKTDWRAYIKVTVSNSVITNAGDLAEKHGLRGSDAVHLSSAVRLRNLSLDEVRVSVADRELRTAALAEGFVVV